MTKLTLSAVLAAAVSVLAVAPASAEEFTAQVSYGDLNLASAHGARTLADRVDATCAARPDIRDLQAMSDWQQCRDSVRNSAMEQLNSKGVTFDSAAFIGA